MVAIEYHHYESRTRTKRPRERWKSQYRAQRIRSYAHNGRAEAWRLIFLGLTLFWALFAYGVHIVL
ncbi:MAG TPA: hypothetical protein VGM26_07860 [Rhizomicrobium sp.]|jgi:hypothetical protein